MFFFYYFNNDGLLNFLIFQPFNNTLKRLGNTEKVVSCKSKVLSDKKLSAFTTADNSLPQLTGAKTQIFD